MPAAPADRAGALLTIDLAAIRANYRLLRERLNGATCAAVVKADAYGLGARPVATALVDADCRHFFVAHLDEGVALRPNLPTDVELFVLHGAPPGTEADCLEHGLIPVLNGLEQVDGWTALARERGRALPAILQIDTGMSRLGLSPRELDAVTAEPGRLDGIDLRYVMSHLACAEQQDQPMNAGQLARFHAARERLPAAPASFANSSGIFLGAGYHFDLARPGAALYGVAPVAGRPNPMRPVIRLEGRVIQVRDIGAGDLVGYGATWRAAAPARIATVAVGYADGFPRTLSNRAVAYAGDTAVPLVGIVSMDTVTFDVSSLPESEVPKPGGTVELIGERHPVDALAREAGTIGYEILTSLGGRYSRRYIGA
jgi:alanine racemase